MGKRIVSGVQPSGKLHLGNWFGAIKNPSLRTFRRERFYFIATLFSDDFARMPRAAVTFA